MTPEKFKHIRTNILGLKLYELADIMGWHQNTAGNYERGVTAISKETAYAMYWLATFGPGDPDSDEWRPRFIQAP